jgi:putative FmdB family regulatory protein
MPVYDYDCHECGVFTALRPIAQCKSAMECPNCGQDARRAFISAPALASMSSERRKAHAINEKSSHEPRASRAGSPHGGRCSCCQPSGSKDATSNATKSFPKSRPWMISH